MKKTKALFQKIPKEIFTDKLFFLQASWGGYRTVWDKKNSASKHFVVKNFKQVSSYVVDDEGRKTVAIKYVPKGKYEVTETVQVFDGDIPFGNQTVKYFLNEDIVQLNSRKYDGVVNIDGTPFSVKYKISENGLSRVFENEEVRIVDIFNNYKGDGVLELPEYGVDWTDQF